VYAEIRRGVLRKSSQILTLQKSEPSVQRGVVMLARRWPGGANVAGELGMDSAELGDFVHGGGVDLFLGVEAGAHGLFVEDHSVTPSLTWAQSMRKVPLSLKSRPLKRRRLPTAIGEVFRDWVLLST
jgi:hypothetical protein